ncbi:MAG: preprotein translocase subunit SecE [Chitinivibrionales bacterium]|nr:preprotein translocase subunit SecE [Chitinivibrionales bacterium]
MKKFIQYLKDVRLEMSKVSWPTRDEIFSATLLVSVLSIVVAICVKLFDMALSRILNIFLNI